MNFGEDVFLYCERGTNAALLAEPINAVSNAAFLLAGLVGLQLVMWRPPEERNPDLFLLPVLVLFIGLGSLAFHLYADQGAALADVLPISLFMLVYLGFALNRFLGVPAGRAGYSTVIESPPARLLRSDIKETHVLGVLLDEAAAALDVVAHQGGEDLVGGGRVVDRDLQQGAGLGVHGGLPHHFRLVFTQAFGTLYAIFSANFGDNRLFLLFRVCKISTILGRDLEKRAFGNEDLTGLNQGGR